MEGLNAVVLDRAALHPYFCSNESSDELEVSEIRPLHPSHELKKRQIPNVDVGPWLRTELPYEAEASPLLRLVWVRLHKDVHPWQLNIRKSNLDAVLENFKIGEVYRYSFTSPSSFAIMPASQTEHSKSLVFSLFMPDLFAIAWTHDAGSRRTEGICWADDWISEAMQDIVSHQKGWVRHPFFLALVVSVMLGNLLDRDLDREVKRIAAVENRTRYHGFKHTSVGIAEGDYASLSRRMSGCAVSLLGLERIFKVLNEFLSEISLHSQNYGVDGDSKMVDIDLEVNGCVETLKRKLKMQKIQIDFLSGRVEVQLTALFNLIAQKEAKVGIAVAEDSRTLASASKDDSTAMKTLAAVTVAFLPGTFVAAFFSMPLFEWDAVDKGTVVSKRFWIYWAVTVPLTFLTLVVWVLWTSRQARVQRVSEKKAREELRIDIELEKSGGVEEKEVRA